MRNAYALFVYRVADPLDEDFSLPEDDTLYEDIIHESNENDAGAPSIKMSMNAKLTDNERLQNRHQQDQHQRHQQQNHPQHLQHAKNSDGEEASPAQAMLSQAGETELDITALPHKVGWSINYGERAKS